MKKIAIKEKTKKVIYSSSALALCVTALFAFWMSNRNNNAVPKPSESLTEEQPPEITIPIEVNNPVTNVADERYSEPAESDTEPQSRYYALPLENGASKEYSAGEIVKNITTDDWRTHNGVDLKGVTGDPVKAICDGTVVDVYDDALWGSVVIIDHGNGITAKYCGLGKGSTVEKGNNIKINDKVGNLGEVPVEKGDGTHLHLEIYKDGKTVSPMDYIGKTV